jgi:hypothetical protein
VEGRSEGKRRLTIREAATLLNLHPNTVRSRIKDGTYEAEKVVTERGPTWLIDPDSLTTNTPPSGSQQLVGRVPEEALTILARAIVREAGMQRDPEREAQLEANKLVAEAAKTHILLSSGALVGMAAVVGVLPSNNHLGVLWGAVFILGLSVLLGFTWMIDVAMRVAGQRSGLGRVSAVAVVALGSGLSVFAFYVFLNTWPLADERSTSWTREEVVSFSLAAGAVFLVFLYAVNRLRRRRRRRAETRSWWRRVFGG